MIDIQLAKAYINKVNSCVQRGIPFELTFSQFRKLMLTKRCYYTGKLMQLQLGVEAARSAVNRVTIDRVDNRLGYTKQNSVACCDNINSWKNQVVEQFGLTERGLNVLDLMRTLSKL